MYIAIAGNIGSGKSCLARMLSEALGWRVMSDSEENPYIGDFYNNMNRWAFNLQVYFLGKRLRQISAIDCSGENRILDRTVYEDAEVFAKNLFNSSVISHRDYETYKQLYDFTVSHLPKPDLLIYLKASHTTLKSQIQKRGRPYELSIDEGYLRRLNSLYNEWISTYSGKLMVIEVAKTDFVNDDECFESIVREVRSLIGK